MGPTSAPFASLSKITRTTALRTIVLEMKNTANQEWVEVDLTIAQVKALFVLELHGAITVGQAAPTYLGTGKPAASALVDRLVQSGLVSRAEDIVDRRRTIIQLTPRGGDLMTRLSQGRRERMNFALSQMNDGDLRALSQGLRAMAAVLLSSRPLTEDKIMGQREGQTSK